MRVSVGQVCNTPDTAANRARVKGLIEEASRSGAGLILLPEMSVLEFFPRIPHRYEYFALAEPVCGPTFDFFSEVARKCGINVVYNHYERSPEGICFDTSIVVGRRGEYVGRQRMMHIAEEPGYNEKFYYTPGWDGYNIFELEGWKLGIAICYDRHFPEVFRSFILQGAELVLIPTAVAGSEPFAAVYEPEMRAAAVTHGVYIAMANRAGSEPPLGFLGHSMIIDPLGQVVESLGEQTNTVCAASLEHEKVLHARTLFPFLRDRRPETYQLLSQAPSVGRA